MTEEMKTGIADLTVPGNPYRVVKCSLAEHNSVCAEFETWEMALDFCRYYDWEIEDENGFVWDLIIEENENGEESEL